MRIAIIGLSLACTLVTAFAQCPTRTQLYSELQAIMAPGKDKLLLNQQKELKEWLKRWRACHSVVDSSYVSALNQMALSLYNSNENTMAIRYAQAAIAKYKTPSLRLKISDLAKTYFRLGIYLDYAGEGEKSIESLLKATEIGRQHPVASQWAAKAYPYIIYYYFRTG